MVPAGSSEDVGRSVSSVDEADVAASGSKLSIDSVVQASGGTSLAACFRPEGSSFSTCGS